MARLDKAQSEDDFRAILAGQELSAEETETLIEQLRLADAELSKDQLDRDTAAGKPHFQILNAKPAYRAKHRKFFVKAACNEDKGTITVCSRFGEEVCETSDY